MGDSDTELSSFLFKEEEGKAGKAGWENKFTYAILVSKLHKGTKPHQAGPMYTKQVNTLGG